MNRLLVVLFLSPFLAPLTWAAPSFVLPKRLYATPGRECAVYYTSVFSSVTPANYAYEAQSQVGRSYLQHWCWTPRKEDAGKELELVLRAWTDDGCVASCTTTVEVAALARNSKRNARVALFADSLTNSGYQNELFRVLKADGFTGYTPVGSRMPKIAGGVRHDGYGGYDCKAFLTYYVVSEDEINRVQDAAEREQLLSLGLPVKVVSDWQRELLKSPLINFTDGKKTVDVPGWIKRASDGVAPDIVIVQLGVNAVFGKRGSANEMREDIRLRVIPEFRAFISALREHMPNAVFGITTQPLGCGQDGFAANYGARFGEVQHRVTMFVLNGEIERFVLGLADPLVELVPLAHAIDPVAGFPRKEVPANSRTEAKVLKSVNALHPTAEGGYQMADAIAAWYECRWNSWSVSKQ
jgi:hypothetical protein